ncbi:DUF2799 domain-containing protein [uncultured Nitratireductor sp.]|uniref:DUF2799 domain-containing protein n=1 Tax=uncultured Nitratireductor sp. TaxID=520953 RepID=UPI0025F73067|nr:DUF2799 domain-containing protein [uncultured Nitratireductor sp.]
MRSTGLIAGLAFMLSLSACATLNESECESVNWSELGRNDGAAGRNISHVQQHRKACAKFDLPVDENAWRTGWEEGIRRYCTPQNGLSKGRDGRSYANSCPSDVAAGFESAYRVGKRVHDARSDYDRLKRELERLYDDLDDAAKGEERRKVRNRISLKESDLFLAEGRVRDAERLYDRYLYDEAAGRS